jgi:hypothetical protein
MQRDLECDYSPMERMKSLRRGGWPGVELELGSADGAPS